MTDHSDYPVQTAGQSDAPALKTLWKSVFSDSDADIERFFDVYFSPELTVVIKDGDKVISAAYILPIGDLVLPGGARQRCAMLYAISTLSDYRGRGFGGAATRAAAALALEKGFNAVVLKPAEPDLFGFYEKNTGFIPFFEAVEEEYLLKTIPASRKACALTAAVPSSYRRARRHILDGGVYIDANERALSYQRKLCSESGGGLYIITAGGDDAGCAVVELEGGNVFVKELLLTGSCNIEDAVSAIAERHPAERVIVRFPTGIRSTRREKNLPFGMIFPNKSLTGIEDLQNAKWYGLAFD